MHRKAWMWSHGEGQLLRGAPVTRVGAVSRASWACNRWRLVLHVMHAGSRLGQTRGLYRTRRAVFHPGEGGECSPSSELLRRRCIKDLRSGKSDSIDQGEVSSGNGQMSRATTNLRTRTRRVRKRRAATILLVCHQMFLIVFYKP